VGGAEAHEPCPNGRESTHWAVSALWQVDELPIDPSAMVLNGQHLPWW